MRVWGLLLSPRDAEAVRRTAQRLKRLARLVGQVRDRDVTLGLVTRAGPAGAARAEAREAARYLARIRDEASTGRELLRVHLRTEAEAGLFLGLRQLSDRPGRRSRGARFPPLLTSELEARRRKLSRAHRRAGKRPTPERLHELRIRIRRLRHLEELADALALSPPTALPRELRGLQNLLGRIHDLDVALGSMGPKLRRSAWARRLREVRRRERATASRSIVRLERALGVYREPRTPPNPQ